jgi:hypothetical protein
MNIGTEGSNSEPQGKNKMARKEHANEYRAAR